MLVKIDDKTLSVVWRYEYPNGVRKTTCMIKNGIGKEAPRLTEASASCNVNDQDCKNCARKVTLQRVLEKFTADKVVRALFWKSYKEMRKSDKNPEGKW